MTTTTEALIVTTETRTCYRKGCHRPAEGRGLHAVCWLHALFAAGRRNQR